MSSKEGMNMTESESKSVWTFDLEKFGARIYTIVDEAFRITPTCLSQEGLILALWDEWRSVVDQYPYEVYGWGWLPHAWSMADFTDTELNAEIESFRQWVDHRWAHFVDQMRIFLCTEMLSPESRRKHWPRQILRNAEVIRRTVESNESLFFSQVSLHLVTEWMWLIMGKHFPQLKDHTEKLYYLQLDRPVGASRGVETSLVKFDFDFSTPVVHAYPINESDVHDKTLVDDVREFGFSMVHGKRLPNRCLIDSKPEPSSE
jgi:hypothetical protein